MGRLLDEDDVIEALNFDTGIIPFYKERRSEKAILEDAKRRINNLPSAQPELIRCKDCKNWDTTWQNDWAKNYHYCPLIDGIRNGDWYCADAERRTDD